VHCCWGCNAAESIDNTDDVAWYRCCADALLVGPMTTVVYQRVQQACDLCRLMHSSISLDELWLQRRVKSIIHHQHHHHHHLSHCHRTRQVQGSCFAADIFHQYFRRKVTPAWEWIQLLGMHLYNNKPFLYENI